MPSIRFPVLINGVPVLTAPGEIDVSNAGQLGLALLRAAGGPAVVVVDMTRTRFCDSKGIRTLVWAHRQTRAAGGELRLVIPAGSAVARVCAITGLDQVIPLFGDLEEACAGGMDRRGTGSGASAPDPPGRADGNEAQTAARHDRRG